MAEFASLSRHVGTTVPTTPSYITPGVLTLRSTGSSPTKAAPAQPPKAHAPMNETQRPRFGATTTLRVAGEPIYLASGAAGRSHSVNRLIFREEAAAGAASADSHANRLRAMLQGLVERRATLRAKVAADEAAAAARRQRFSAWCHSFRQQVMAGQGGQHATLHSPPYGQSAPLTSKPLERTATAPPAWALTSQ